MPPSGWTMTAGNGPGPGGRAPSTWASNSSREKSAAQVISPLGGEWGWISVWFGAPQERHVIRQTLTVATVWIRDGRILETDESTLLRGLTWLRSPSGRAKARIRARR